MLCHAVAPNLVAAPELYARFTAVRELALTWEDFGERPNLEEINLLAEMINIKQETEALKSRVQQGGSR